MNDTRERLLDAARRCIRSGGLTTTTSRQIAAEAGANLGAITYHFGSKDALVAEALLGTIRRWLGPALEVLHGEGDPSARALLAIRTLTTTFAEQRADAPAYLQALVEAPRMPALRAGVVELWGELRQVLGTHIVELQRAGHLPGWIVPDAMAAVLVAAADGLVLQVTVEPGGPGIEAMAAQFAGLLLAARTND